MRREDLEELHYITPIKNVRSIMMHGVLSHRRAASMEHVSVAMEEVQRRRRGKRVPGGRPLHEYVNLYLCARNPMLFKRKEEHQALCILRISPSILDVPGVVVADRNASSDYARFSPVLAGLAPLDRNLVFAEYWTHPDNPLEEMRHKSIKCAEVLVPDHVPPGLIVGAYVSCSESRSALAAQTPSLPIVIDPHLFFQRPR